MLSCSIPFVHYEHNLFISRPNHDSNSFSHRKITSSGWKSTVCLLQYLCFLCILSSVQFSPSCLPFSGYLASNVSLSIPRHRCKCPAPGKRRTSHVTRREYGPRAACYIRGLEPGEPDLRAQAD